MRRILKGIGLLLLIVVLLTGAATARLFLTAPEPRQVEGWFLGPPLPTARGELATAVAHSEPCPEPPCPEVERLYVLGGLAGLASAQDRVSSYDPVTRRWSTAPPLPAPRHHLGAVGLDQTIYVSGGTADTSQPWTPEDNFWRLGVGADRWESLPSMPEGRWGHRLVAYGGRLYVIGGQGPSSRVLIYSPAEGWTTGAEMPVPRHHLSVVGTNGRIWAIGGRHPHSLSRVDIYDPAMDRWEPGPELPAPTSGAAEGVVDGVILVFGGEEASLLRGGVFDRHWMLDTRAAAPGWQPAPPPPLAVHGADGAVFQGTMVIAGGASRHGALSVTSWTDAVQWLQPATIQEPIGDSPLSQLSRVARFARPASAIQR